MTNPGATTAIISAGTFNLYQPTTFNVARGTSPSDLTVSGAINGFTGYGDTSGLTLTGGGIMTLTGNNTYGGSTTISAGTLVVGGAGVLGGGNYAGAISIAGSSALVINSSSNQVFSAAISNSGALLANASGNQTFSGAISGSGGLTQAGPGMLSLTVTAANSYSGSTIVSGGMLVAGVAGLGNSAGVLVSSGGTLMATGDAFGTAVPALTIQGGLVTTGATSGAGSGYHTTIPNIVFNGGGTIASGTGNAGDGYGNYNQYGGGGPGLISVTNPGATTAIISAGVFNLFQNPTFNVARGTSPSDLTVSGAINGTSDGGVSDSNGITLTGGGIMTLTGNNTYGGATTVSVGTLQILGSGVLGGGNYAAAIAVSGSGALVMNTSSNQTFSGVLSGAGNFTQAGPGTVFLTDNYSLTGTTTVSGGMLVTGDAAGLGSASVLVTSGGTLMCTGDAFKIYVPLLTIQGGLVTTGATTGGGYHTTVPNIVFNGGGTIASGAGNAGDGYGNYNQYGGGGPGLVSVTNPGATTAIISAGVFNLYQNTTFNVARGTSPSDLTVSGAINGFTGYGNSSGLALTGGGIMTLTGNNTYGGTTTISAGTLQILGSGDLGGGNYAGNISIANSGALVINTSSNQTFSGEISGPGPLVQAGPGVLTLSNPTAFGGVATVNINAGTVQLNTAANGSGYAALAGGANVAVNAGGTLVLSNTNALGFYGGAANLTVNSGGLVYATSGLNVSLWNAVGMTGGTLASAGAGDPTYGNYDINGQLNATSDASGNPAVINAAQIELQNSLGTVFNVTRGPGASDLDVSSAITNIGVFVYGLTQSGNGIMVLTGSNTYTGSTAISGGTLQILGSGVLGGGNYAGNISIAGSAALIVNTSSNQTFGGTISGAGSLTQAGPGTLTLNGAPNYSGPTTVSGGTLTASMPLPNTSCVAVANGATLDAETNNLTYNGVSYSPAFAPWYVNGTVYSGSGFGQTLGNVTLGGGTLSGNATGAGNYGNYTINGAAYSITSSGNSLINAPAGFSLQGSNALSINVVNPSDVLTISAGIFNAPLSTNPGITLSGSGTLILTGNNTYSGNTNVNAGTLAVNGSLLGSGNVQLNSGGVLTGSGSLGNLYVHVGSVLTPGYGSAGTLTAASLNLNYDGNSTLNYTLGGASPSYLSVAGALTIGSGGTTTLNVFNGSLSAGTYGLIGYGSLTNSWNSGAFTLSNTAWLPAGDGYGLVNAGNVIDLVISASGSQAINGTWNTNGSGTWSTSGNWSGGVPGSGQDTAVFGTALTSGTATVTLDGSRSLASLGFSTTGGNSYVVVASGASTLTLANTLTSTAALSNSGGNHAINAPIVLGSNLSVTATTGSALTIAGGISESSPSTSLSVSGGGEVILSGTDTYTGGTNVSAATLAITSASALSSTGVVTLSGGGQARPGQRLGDWGAVDGLGADRFGRDCVERGGFSSGDARADRKQC